MLERHAAEFARLGGADQVRRDLKQRGLPLQRILGAPALADIEGHSLVFVWRHGHLTRLCAINGETQLVDLDAAIVPSFLLQRKVEAKPTWWLGGRSTSLRQSHAKADQCHSSPEVTVLRLKPIGSPSRRAPSVTGTSPDTASVSR